MIFSFGLKSSVLLIFFFHGIVYTGLLLEKGLKKEHRSSIWLSVFSFLGALYIAPFMLGYAGWYSKQPFRDFLFYFPFQQLFLIPPVLYFYVRTLLDKSFIFNKSDFLHFIPAFAYLIYSVTVFVADKFIYKTNFFYKNEQDKDFDLWYQVTGTFLLFFYLIKSLQIYFQYKSYTYNFVSFADNVLFRWANRFIISFLVLILLRIAFFIINPEWDEFGKKFWYYLCFSVLLYYITIRGYSNSVFTSISFNEFNDTKNSTEITEENEIYNEVDTEYLVKSSDEVQDLEQWKNKIEFLMSDQKMYENPELIITDLSAELGTHSKKISKVINMGYKMNFNDFVNQYRVKALIDKLEEGEFHNKTIIGLAFDCGFNSKSTLNRAFKKYTNVNPMEYIQKMDKK